MIDDYIGASFVPFGDAQYTPPNDPKDLHGHGTADTAIFAARGHNSKRIAGVCWQVPVIPVKILGFTFPATSDVIKGMEYAESRGAKIMNCSWRLFSNQVSLRLEMESMIEVLFVCSAGNESADLDDPNNFFPSYPSLWKLQNVISVGGCLPTDVPTTNGGGPGADGSSYGATTVNIFAPGDQLTSLGSAPPGSPVPNDGALISWGGTSGAAPFVTGVAALVWQLHPSWKPLDVKNKILGTADGPSEGVTGYVGKCTSNGRLNAQRALDQECE